MTGLAGRIDGAAGVHQFIRILGVDGIESLLGGGLKNASTLRKSSEGPVDPMLNVRRREFAGAG